VRSVWAWAKRELLSLGGVLSSPAAAFRRSRPAGPATGCGACARSQPARVPAGEAATVTIQLDNVTRLPTGLLLAEDTIPYSLGTRPRFVLDRIEGRAAAASPTGSSPIAGASTTSAR
jgi:hypothetical protein